MINYVEYDNLGRIISYGNALEIDYLDMINNNKTVLEIPGNIYDITKYYVEDSTLVIIPEPPGVNYVFDYATKTWVLDNSILIDNILRTRNQLLQDGPDRLNPLWYDIMSTEEKDMWKQYRQNLLDITSQPNYPYSIVWPTKP